MSKKQSFAKLTEDLDNLTDEQVEKSADEKVEPKTATSEDVDVVTPETEDKKEEKPEDTEEVKKSSDDEEEKDSDDSGKAKGQKDIDDAIEAPLDPGGSVKNEVKDGDGKQESLPGNTEQADNESSTESKGSPVIEPELVTPAAEEHKDDENDGKGEEKVEKSDVVSEQDFIGAFEAVVKSYTALKSEIKAVSNVSERMDKLEKSMDKILEFISKSDEGKEEDSKETVEEKATDEKQAEDTEDEKVEKSADKPEESLEGKAVEYVSKSNGVPEVEIEGTDDGEGAEEAPFNPIEHVKTVTEYYTKNAKSMSMGDKNDYRAAVNRVKRGEQTAQDVEIFREVVKKSEN